MGHYFNTCWKLPAVLAMFHAARRNRDHGGRLSCTFEYGSKTVADFEDSSAAMTSREHQARLFVFVVVVVIIVVVLVVVVVVGGVLVVVVVVIVGVGVRVVIVVVVVVVVVIVSNTQ